MPYSAEINRANPTCFLFLIDQSLSMLKPMAGDPSRTKAEAVADAVNELLYALVFRCVAGTNVLDRLFVGVLGYGAHVGPAFGGVLIALTPDGSSRYSIGGVSGRSLFTFRIVESGLYRFIAAYDDGRTTPSGVLAIGRDFVKDLLTTILVSLAIAFGGAAIAGAIAFGVYRRRRTLAPPLAR